MPLSWQGSKKQPFRHPWRQNFSTPDLNEFYIHVVIYITSTYMINSITQDYIFALNKHMHTKPGRLQSMGLQRVRHDWATSLWLFTFMHWRRKWQPTPVFLPGESQGQRSLVGCYLWGRTESDTTEATQQQQQQHAYQRNWEEKLVTYFYNTYIYSDSRHF